MPPRKVTLAEQLDTIADKAPALRKAGVLTFDVGGVIVHLAPHVEPAPPDRNERVEDEYLDPLQDPATYGNRSGVPGYQRPAPDDSEYSD